MEQELLALPEQLVFTCVRVTLSVVYCVRFVNRCLSLSLGHCVAGPFSTYGFWLPLWYLQTLLTNIPVDTRLPSNVETASGRWNGVVLLLVGHIRSWVVTRNYHPVILHFCLHIYFQYNFFKLTKGGKRRERGGRG